MLRKERKGPTHTYRGKRWRIKQECSEYVGKGMLSLLFGIYDQESAIAAAQSVCSDFAIAAVAKELGLVASVPSSLTPVHLILLQHRYIACSSQSSKPAIGEVREASLGRSRGFLSGDIRLRVPRFQHGRELHSRLENCSID